MTTALLVLSIVVPIVLALTLTLLLTSGWVRRKSERLIQAKFDKSAIQLQAPGANFFGQTSGGAMQLRGNGALALTDEELWFGLLVPRREISVRRKSITSARLKNSHLGKTVLRPLLYVEFQTPEGPDSCAWLVPDPQRWVDALEHPSPVRGGFRIAQGFAPAGARSAPPARNEANRG